MNKIRTWWVLAVVGVVATAAIGATTGVMAQTPVPGINDTGTTFIDRVAEKLGISSDTLSEAVKSSADDVIDEKVASGELTQEQADAMKTRIANAPDEALGGIGRGPGFGHRGGFGFFGGDELATFLGITTDDLRTEMQGDGATLATVAAAHGKSRDELKAFLTDQIKARLDEGVASGEHTQADADQKLANFTANLDAMIDGTMPQGGPGMHRGGPGGFGDFDGDFGGTPSDNAAPQSGATQSGADQG